MKATVKLHNTAIYDNIFPVSSDIPSDVRSKLTEKTVKMIPKRTNQ